MTTPFDLTEFRQRSGVRQVCGVQRLTAEITPVIQLEAFEAAMEDRTISAQAISAVLKDWGYTIGSQVIQRHRIKACSCAKRGLA
jgi:hypothetical protein